MREVRSFHCKRVRNGAVHSRIAMGALPLATRPERSASSQRACGAAKSGIEKVTEYAKVAKPIRIQKSKGTRLPATAKKKRVRAILLIAAKTDHTAKYVVAEKARRAPAPK